MGTAGGDEFFKKVYPIVSDIAFENDIQIMRSATVQTLARPVSFKATWLARLPKNLDIIQFLLKLLKALGQIPFCHDSKNAVYYFAWLSLDIVMSSFVSLTTIFGWFVFVSHIVFKKFLVFGPGIRSRLTAMEERLKSNSEMDEHQIEANVHALAIMDTCIALSQFVYIINGWKNRHRLIAIMNRWTHVQRSLKTVLFANRRYTGSETEKYYLSISVGAAFILLAAVGPRLLAFNTSSHPDRALESTFLPLIFSYYCISEALQDALVNLMFYELSKSMRLVRQQILLDIESGTVSQNRIRTWRRILLSIRQQTDRISEYISMPQLLLLLQSLLLGTMAIFTALMNGYGTNSAGIQTASLSLFVWVLVRLFVKASLAEKITAEEGLLATELLDWNVKGSDAMETEIRDLRNLLLCHPVKINLSNIVVLERQVCLKVISQIVTYLIVIIQFYNEK